MDSCSRLGVHPWGGTMQWTSFFHAFSGCNVISGFNGKGKKRAWQTWKVFDEAAPTFVKLRHTPIEIENCDATVEKYVVLMYIRSSETSLVEETRLDLFAKKQRSFDSIPPTQSALKEHAKRVAYHAGHIW